MDNAMMLTPIDRRNRQELYGCFLHSMERDEALNADVFVFLNPYRKTKIDVVFCHGEMYIGEWYGEAMDRKSIFYIPHSGR